MPRKFMAMAAAALALLSAAVAPALAEPVKNVVLVHGAFADGSGWRRVADILGKDGYTVSVVKSWALVATHDHNINPDLERSMAKHAGSETIEVPASHAAYISKPNDVARLIERAAKASAR
jgi:pimeloyl-ACP methyl ester carboxylesterase